MHSSGSSWVSKERKRACKPPAQGWVSTTDQKDAIVCKSQFYIRAQFWAVGNFMRKLGLKTHFFLLNIHFWLALVFSHSLCPIFSTHCTGLWVLTCAPCIPLPKLPDFLTVQGPCFFVYLGLRVLASSSLSTEQQKPFNRPVSLVLSSQSEMSCPQKPFFPFVLSSGFCSYPFSFLTVAI